MWGSGPQAWPSGGALSAADTAPWSRLGWAPAGGLVPVDTGPALICPAMPPELCQALELSTSPFRTVLPCAYYGNHLWTLWFKETPQPLDFPSSSGRPQVHLQDSRAPGTQFEKHGSGQASSAERLETLLLGLSEQEFSKAKVSKGTLMSPWGGGHGGLHKSRA